MNANYLRPVLLVLSGAALSVAAQGDPLSVQTEILRLQADTHAAGVAELASRADPDGNAIVTDLGPEALAGLRSEPAGAIEKPVMNAPEPSTMFTFLAGMAALAALGLRRKFLRPEHRSLRKRIRIPFRMMA